MKIPTAALLIVLTFPNAAPVSILTPFVPVAARGLHKPQNYDLLVAIPATRAMPTPAACQAGVIC